MTKIKFFIAILVFGCSLVSVTHAETYRCETLFPLNGDIQLQPSADFRVVANNPFLSFRGSVAHYWNYIRQMAGLSKTKRLLSFVGLVVGDFHPGNWGDIELKNDKEPRKTGLIDLDDVGVRAPLLGDFVRGAIGIELAEIPISHELLWQAYLVGLKGDRVPKPERLKKIQNKSAVDFEQRQQRYLIEIIEDRSNGSSISGSKFKTGKQITPLSDAPFLARHLYKEMAPQFKNLFSNFVILDVGFRMKFIGGSQRLPRFLFLIADHRTGQRRVVEAKYLVEPGTNRFANQGRHTRRIEVAGGLYRPEGEPVGIYTVLETSTHTFQIRERFSSYVDFDPIKLKSKLLSKAKPNLEELEKTILYIFNQLGRFQRGQRIAASFLKEIERDPDISTNGVKDLIQLYAEEAKALAGSTAKKE